MIDLVIYVAVICILAVLLWWLLSQVPLPEPIKKVLTIVFVVVVVLIIVILLLQLAGSGGSLPRLR